MMTTPQLIRKPDSPGLNGDLLVWDKILDRSVELSSMGIRVDKEALLRQLDTSADRKKRKELYFHKTPAK